MAEVSTEEDPSAETPLSVRERLAYSFFNGADYLLKNIIGKYMFFFYTTTFAINPLWLAFGQPLLKILDVVTDPLVGEWSDRTRSRMGKRRPWILFGSIALGILFPLSWMPTFIMFWDPAPTALSIFIYFLIFKALYYISHTVAVVPYYALGAELSRDYQERIGSPVKMFALYDFANHQKTIGFNGFDSNKVSPAYDFCKNFASCLGFF